MRWSIDEGESKRRRRHVHSMRGRRRGRRCTATAATGKGGGGAALKEGNGEGRDQHQPKRPGCWAGCGKRIENGKTSRAGSWAEWLWAGQRKREIALQILLSNFQLEFKT
jgi:hypothetical protein